MRSKRPSVNSFSMKSFPNKSAGSVFINPASGGGVAPTNTVAPVISGSTSLGSTLSCTTGTWTGTPNTFTYSYQWRRNGVDIGGATSSTYVTVVADSTANITCVVTATNGVAPDGTATSNTLTMANYTPTNTVAPVISGTAIVSQTLSTTNGTWTNSPTSYTYQWKRGGSDIVGATSQTYVLVAADAGQAITCAVTASNGLTSSPATSNTINVYSSLYDVIGVNAHTGYSTNRLLRGAYYGSPIVRVRRSGDNSESDFGVTTSGLLDTASMTAFCIAGGGTRHGFVTTIYDQTGNARHNVQTSPANQFQIVTNGSLYTWSSGWAINGTGNQRSIIASNFTAVTQPYTTVVVGQINSDLRFITDGATGNQNSLLQTSGTLRLANNNAGPFITATNALSNRFTAWSLANSPNSRLSINGGAETNGNTNTDSATNISIGGLSLSLIGFFAELHFFNSNQASNKSSILTNIRAYYGHY